MKPHLLSKHSWAVIVASLLTAGSAMALPLGTNVTISDMNNNGANPSVAANWYSDREDNETETNPSTINNQSWDLEGMYVNGDTLSLVGGYNFKAGNPYGGYTYKSGDIFIDTNGNAVYGQVANGGSGATGWGTPQPLITTNLFGYDYVLDLNYTSMTYDLVQLTPGSQVTRVIDVASSNPWTYVSNTGTVLQSGLAFTFGSLGAADVTSNGLLGDGSNNNHYYITGFDLGFLNGATATLHYTIECGNDDLMGRVSNVPETSSTLMLLGAALAALAAFKRRS